MKNLKIHEKSTYAAQINAKLTRRRKQLMEEILKEDEKVGTDRHKLNGLQDDPSWKLEVTKDRRTEKESLHDYIAKKRELFLLQYSLAVKREEMQKLEHVGTSEEQKLEKAEQFLEEDAAMFDEFLKENDKNSVEAVRIAEMETKAKLEKMAKIKKITAQMVAIKSEISKNEEILQEYRMYKKFLLKLSPVEWQEKQYKKMIEAKKAKMAARGKDKCGQEDKTSQLTNHSQKLENRSSSRGIRNSPRALTRTSSKQSFKSGTSRKPSRTPSQIQSKEEEYSSSDSDEEPELYFTDPQQLLDLFTELEEQNLSLIQNSQETEETLEQIKQNIISTQNKMNHETNLLQQQIDSLKDTITKEEERARELELKSRVFSFGQFSADDQDKTLEMLNKKVAEVYRACSGGNEANLSTLQMLTSVENQLEELIENLEMIPPERVEIAEKAKEKERRLRLREEKLKQQKQHQEERLRRALERARADPKKKTGRKMMFRSEPPVPKHKEDLDQEATDKEKEEMIYYFT
ncbi:cilia- and flagella-associated protein 100 [Protopterus annectens]|uniref:cilia- and flagella-associated protein 100 n=1 Tax=Protopterus annectens TaxID=7888 RepID=UPI001CFC0E65|nr:cilia- and flagella-associated protein 100 [Protopterus annectens]